MSSESTPKPKLGIIGGSGLCSFPELKEIGRSRPTTPFGEPSDEIIIGEYADQVVAFLPRHGSRHTLAPHRVPYRANLCALRQLGVEYVLATCIVGSLRRELMPGTFVLLDQFVNLTWGRDSEAPDGPLIHLPMAYPYCAHLRSVLQVAALETRLPMAERGTVAVIQGPRFSTVAESQWFMANGWDVVNMTQFPECYIARELGMCYAAVAAITDYDVGLSLPTNIQDAGRFEEVLKIFRQNTETLKRFLLHLIQHGTAGLSCKCAAAHVQSYLG